MLAGPARGARLDEARAAIAELEMEVVPLEEDAPARLAMLRAGTGLRMPGCCVLLAAQTAAAEVVLTFDDAIAREARRLGLRGGG